MFQENRRRTFLIRVPRNLEPVPANQIRTRKSYLFYPFILLVTNCNISDDHRQRQHAGKQSSISKLLPLTAPILAGIASTSVRHHFGRESVR